MDLIYALDSLGEEPVHKGLALKRLGRLPLTCVAFVALLATAQQVGAADPIKLIMVGAWSPGVSAAAAVGLRFAEEVNERADGELVIEFKGASEVFPVFDQPEALVRGVIDVWYGAPNYWAGVVAGGYVTELSPLPIPDGGPGHELFELMVQLYARRGVRYLGHFSGAPGTGNHFMYVQQRIASIADLEGMKIRVPPLTRFFVNGVGAEPVTLPPGEVYLALERGTVEGFTWPYYDGFTNFGWHEVSKFIVSHPLYRNGASITMNLETWNSLPEDMQHIVLDAVRDIQVWALEWIAAQQRVQLTTMTAGGMGVISFSETDARRWDETDSATLWAQFKKVMSAEDFNKARTLMGYK